MIDNKLNCNLNNMTDVKSYLILLVSILMGGGIFFICSTYKEQLHIYRERVGHIFDKSMTIEGQLLIDNRYLHYEGKNLWIA